MAISLPSKYFKLLKDDHLSLLYHGTFRDEIVPKIIALSEYDLHSAHESVKMKNRVSFLIAECFQNILRHGEKINPDSSLQQNQSFFLLRNRNEKYFISSANPLQKDKVETLEFKLNSVNDLNTEELKKLHQLILKEGGLSEKGGAGLGLISIAKKSGQKIEYAFDEFNDEVSIFHNQIILPLEENMHNPNENNQQFNEARALYDSIKHDEIILIQKGNFEHEAILKLLNILENNLKEYIDNAYDGKYVYHVIVEMLQNISEHAASKDGHKEAIIIVSKRDNEFMVHTGNYIENSKVTPFSKELEFINSLSKDELKNLYLDKLKNEKENEYASAQVGMIDIARTAKKPLEFNIERYNDQLSFLSLSVTL